MPEHDFDTEGEAYDFIENHTDEKAVVVHEDGGPVYLTHTDDGERIVVLVWEDEERPRATTTPIGDGHPLDYETTVIDADEVPSR